MANCRSCDAEMRWAISASSGKPIPLDVAPCDDGNLVVETKHGESVARAATPDDKRLQRERFKSHFATCPQAATWRNRS